MANLTGSASYQDYIRQLETTDPSHPDTWNPNYQDLINNDVYLKQEVDQNKADIVSVQSAVAEDMENAHLGMLTQALDLAGLANREIRATLNKRFQTGVVTIKNRGIISGCDVTKSNTATRNLSLATGVLFMGGRQLPAAGETNGASVPANPGETTQSCYAYLQLSGGALIFSCTALGEPVPAGGFALYRVDIPAGNDEAGDPYLGNCALVDIRRVEAGYPQQVNSSPVEYVELTYDMDGTEYQIDLEAETFDGSSYGLGYFYTANKAVNGFDVYYNGTADNLQIRWTARKLDM